MPTVTPTWKNVRPLGRTREMGDALWLALSATGAEFAFNGSCCEVVLAGDSVAADPAAKDNRTRIAICLNGARVGDDLLDAPEKTYALPCAPGENTVRILKLSETAMSTCAIRSITVDDPNGVRPTPAKARYIEFIGDSITCGYGVDDEDGEHHFVTATEDPTRAYACKTAQLLEADYSLVSISGYGVISGYTATAEEPVTAQLIPTYYEKLGFSYGSYQGATPADFPWDFTVRQPDLIVINLGTNDDSYCLDRADRQQHYCREYANFLRTVRLHNPTAKILCTLGIMGDRLYPYVEKAAADYAAQTGDTNISCMAFTPQLPEDGFAADYHPTEHTHQKAAEKLSAHIRALMNW